MFDDVPLVAVIILYIVGAGLWTYAWMYWKDAGYFTGVFTIGLVYLAIIPLAYGIAWYYANK